MKFIEESATAFLANKDIKKIGLQKQFATLQAIPCNISIAMCIVEGLDESRTNTLLTSLIKLLNYIVMNTFYVLLDLIVIMKKV